MLPITLIYEDLPEYVREVIDNLNYVFSYAREEEKYFFLYTGSGFCYEIVEKIKS